MYKVRKNYVVKVGRTVLTSGNIIPEHMLKEVLQGQSFKIEKIENEPAEENTKIKDVVLNKAMGKEKVKEK